MLPSCVMIILPFTESVLFVAKAALAVKVTHVRGHVCNSAVWCMQVLSPTQ